MALWGLCGAWESGQADLLTAALRSDPAALSPSHGREAVHSDTLGCCPSLTAGSNCAELHGARAGKGVFGEICLIFMIPNLPVF